LFLIFYCNIFITVLPYLRLDKIQAEGWVLPVVSVRISEETKRRMEKLRHINWSEVIRKAILKVIEEEEDRNLARAVLITEKVRKKAPKGWDSSQIIRYWRDSRYGEGSS